MLVGYPDSVCKPLAGKPYHKGKPALSRAFHHYLRVAHDQLIPVIVTVLESCPTADLNARERHGITVRRKQADDSGLRVLNFTPPMGNR